MRSRSGSIEATLRLRVLVVAASICLVAGCKPAARSGAILSLQAPADDRDADVFVDGNYIGQIGDLGTAGTSGLQLAPGVHRVEIRKYGRFPVQKTVRVDSTSGPSVIVHVELLEDPE